MATQHITPMQKLCLILDLNGYIQGDPMKRNFFEKLLDLNDGRFYFWCPKLDLFLQHIFVAFVVGI